MACPRVFVSSTFYDLKYIRASLDLFITSLGYDSVLSEKGDIAYGPDDPLDDSCYREVLNADLFVLIIGGRYGSIASSEKDKDGKEPPDQYESITKKEYETAQARNIPTFILIEKGVYSEYQTFRRNKENKDIAYAHVDNVNIYFFIEKILNTQNNNPIHPFEKFEEIQSWLRSQWAGNYRELLRRRSDQKQIAGVEARVTELKEINETLRTYLEAIMEGKTEPEKTRIVEFEGKRLEESRRLSELKNNSVGRYIIEKLGVKAEELEKALSNAREFDEFLLSLKLRDSEDTLQLHSWAAIHPSFRDDVDICRRIVAKPAFDWTDIADTKPLTKAAVEITASRKAFRKKSS